MVDVLLVAAFFLIVALVSGIRRSGTMQPRHLVPALAASALFAAAVFAAWLLQVGGPWLAAAGPRSGQGIPPIVWVSALVLLGIVVVRRILDAPPEHAAPVSRYESDPTWYRSKWRRDPNNPDHDLGTDGIPFELDDGPLVHRVGRLRDSRFALWVTLLADGTHAVWGGIEAPARVPTGGRLLGAYVFSESAEGMVWTSSAVNNTTVL